MDITKSIFKIPDNTSLLKISSINVNLVDSINRNDNIRTIVEYIFAEIYDTINDIITIQGINDHHAAILLMREIYKESNRRKKSVHIVPKLEMKNSDSFDNSFQFQWNSTSEIIEYELSNIIISRYPIITTSNVNLNSLAEEKLVGNKKVIIANINVNGYLISIYNVTLTDDYLNISNSEFRKKEVKSITKIIKTNSEQTKKHNESVGNRLIIKDVHIVCGNFNISETKGTSMNNELVQVLKTLKAIDIFRYYNIINKNNDHGHTSVHNKRDCYITIILFDHKMENETVTPDIILNKVYKNHGIGIILPYVVQTIKINDNYPIETILLLNNEEKQHVIEF